MRNRVGEIRHVPSEQRSRYGHGAWYIVERDEGHAVFGRRFVKADEPAYNRYLRSGEVIDLTQTDPVPDDEVPEWVLVELAKFKLSAADAD